MKKMWKCLNDELKSEYDGSSWELKKWRKIIEKPIRCVVGFHASENLIDAFSYVKPGIIARVEVGGKSDIGKDKSAFQKMRVTKAWKWTPRDSVALAVFAAELSIEFYKQEFPGDLRSLNAINAAKRYFENPTEENRTAANAAHAAAYAAANAAANAANAANAAHAAHAANAANAAANAANAANAAHAANAANAAHAAYAAANAAAYAAYAAANAAAYAAVKKKCHNFIVKRLKQCEEVEE